MQIYPDLSLAQTALGGQSTLYQPTSFWEEAAKLIAEELLASGVEQFRRQKTALRFFVPTYGPPGNGFSQAYLTKVKATPRAREAGSDKSAQGLNHFLSGEMAAMADYRVLLASDNTQQRPYLHWFSECRFGEPEEQFEFGGRHFSRSSLNYLLGLAMLKKHLKGEVLTNILEVGGGFGSLGEILASAGLSCWHYIDIDIPPISFIAEHYLRAALGEERVAGYTETRNLKRIDIDRLPNASALCSWQIGDLHGDIDLFVNYISFQEMEPCVVANYLRHVDRLESRWVLLRNLREGKQQRQPGRDTLGVQTPIRTCDYLAMLPNYKLIESNVIPFGHRTIDGFNSELLVLRRKTRR